MLTRRILINKQESYIRYIDVYRNPTPQEQSLSVQINSNFNYGVAAAQTVSESKTRIGHCVGRADAAGAVYR